MTNNCCTCKPKCTILGITASVIIGIVASLLTVTGNLTLPLPFVWTLFGVAIGFLGVTLLSVSLVRNSYVRECICSTLPALFTGIFGTILTAAVLITIDIAAASVLGAIVTGLLLLFFTLTLTTGACLAKCIAGCGD
ncbi:MAG: hypothetical protein IKM46_08290 [Clostridia bacterium]|nr:hypothetical protein [Clostridia bacterium]